MKIQYIMMLSILLLIFGVLILHKSRQKGEMIEYKEEVWVEAFEDYEGVCLASDYGSIPITLTPQEAQNWCWLSVTEMLGKHYGIQKRQCELANELLNKIDCCNPLNSSSPSQKCRKNPACDRGGNVSKSLAALGLESEVTKHALKWSQIQHEIGCKNTPLAFSYGKPRRRLGHIVIINGFNIVSSGEKYLTVINPEKPCKGQVQVIPYNVYVNPSNDKSKYQGKKRRFTYYDFSKK